MQKQEIKLLRALILSLLLGLTLVGCGSIPAPQVASNPPAQKIEPHTIQRPSRQPGSLWSEDSKWNGIYSETPSRVIGDIITIRLGDSLRARIATKMESLLPKKEEKKDAKAPEKGKEAAPANGRTDKDRRRGASGQGPSD